ncbi:hypothetical protein LSAT2_002266, partial [Lamellibrachia satsuma]
MDAKGTGINTGDTTTVTCHADYEMSEGGKSRTVVCQSDGQWSDQPQCKPITCRFIPHVTNAVANSDVALVGTIVKYTCDGDLLFPTGINTAETQCTSRGVWYPPIEGCQVRCSPVPYLDHAMVDGPYSSLVGSSVKLRCKAGHRFPTGDTQRLVHCQTNREWEDVDDCQVDLCPKLSIPAHGTISTKLTAFGTVVEVKCDTGYRFDDGTRNMAVECVAKNLWNSTLRECRAVFCPEISSIPHATVESNELMFGSEMNVTCEEGYTLDSGRAITVRCNETGKWDGLQDTCQPVTCGPQPVVYYAISQVVMRATYGRSINYTCLSGYWFRQGVFSKLTNCTIDGEWQPTLGHCDGMCYFVFNVDDINMKLKKIV